MKSTKFLVILSLAGIAIVHSVLAEVKLPAVFSDNMVLQQGVALPVWGTAAPGEGVTVTLGERKAQATADAVGKWKCRLEPLPAGGPFTLTVTGTNTLSVQDVLVGEVWLCGGQSNMEFTLDRANNAAVEIAAAKYPEIRMFMTHNAMASQPADEVKGKWVVCSPETAAKFSALGYFFGREIHKARKVPVGLVHCSAGWTPAEAWMSREALLSNPDFKYITERWDKIVADWPTAKPEFDRKMAEWQKAADAAKAAGQAEPPNKPKAPVDPNFFHRASGLWNGSVAPLTAFAIRGVIWYQGETNEVRGYEYRNLFPALIKGWRDAWGDPDLPFLFVQVASVLPPDPEPKESEWAELRESQALTAKSVPHTGMAVTIDIGEEKDVHPKNKQDVGFRLGLVARALVYDEKVEYSGPVYTGMKIEGAKIRLTFDHVAGGLTDNDGKALFGFAVAAADRKFVYADAVIDGDTVVVSAGKVTAPVAVRYAWANNPAGCNLFNKTGLPATPFRTDDWPAKTRDYRKLVVDSF